MRNTLKRGKFRTLIYWDKKEKVFLATVLEFNLTLSSDDKEVLLLEIQQAARDYIELANELKDSSILNQEVDPELEKMWKFMILENKKVAAVKSPYLPISASTIKI